MNKNATVSPQVGFYVLTTVDRRWGVETRFVGKDKQCSCGGNAKRLCYHIRAVADYLRQGGKRASEECTTPRLREMFSARRRKLSPAARARSTTVWPRGERWEK